MAAVCPVIGASATVLPPNHPAYDTSDKEAVCPVTNAKVEHHTIISSHPGAKAESMDATACPALKNVESNCPVVGPVSAVLPPSHPPLTDAGSVCPVTNATLSHHKDKVHEHPSVPNDAAIQQCPVAGASL